ncbi:MAG TPA: citrate/2-methylcitrate synthase [Acidimicrobiales bacterium]|nr:citrate/2-methylcitrate synthase [Acidimicrobiales bacterium]
MGSEWLTAREACERLHVRPQTLYAYVSRGVLDRRREGRQSRFAAADIDALAVRTSRGRRSGRTEILIDTAITDLDPAGRLTYRGVGVDEIVGQWPFERTAAWLWSGEDDPTGGPWAAPSEVASVAHAVQDAIPRSATAAQRVRATVASAGTLLVQEGRDAEAVAACARQLVATIVDGLPSVGKGRRDPEGSIASRLWPALSAQPATPARVAALDAALVLLADHELAASTLAARVAASTWAALPQVVLAGLGALSGPLHGANADAVSQLLAGAERLGARVVLRQHRFVPGFGHAVYRTVDPRFVALMPFVEGMASAALVDAIDGMRRVSAAAGVPPANVDLAFGALARAGRWKPGAAEAVFAVARIAGWAAHAIEEYQHRLRLRPRAVYVGNRWTSPASVGRNPQASK